VGRGFDLIKGGTMSGIFGNITENQGQQRQEDNDPHRPEAVAALKHFKKSFDEYFRLRQLNARAVQGRDPSCEYSPQEMRQRLEFFRDPEMESRFQREYMTLLSQVYGRNPTRVELVAGPPTDENGMGLVPALLGVAAIVAGSAWGLSSVTNYLTERERAARGVVERRGDLGRTLSGAVKGTIAVVVVGGASYGAYRLWKWGKSRPTKTEPSVEIEESIAELEVPPELGTEEEEE
jgi:hypothetical protein